MVEMYYDTPVNTLVKRDCWLRKTGIKWDLKFVDSTTKSEEYYIVSYSRYCDTDALSKVEELGINLKDIVCFATFSVLRYSWEDDFVIDVCKFPGDENYVVGSFHPKLPGKKVINGIRNVNSKVIEFIARFKTDLIQFIPEIQLKSNSYQNFAPPKTTKKIEEEKRRNSREKMLLSLLDSQTIDYNKGKFVLFSIDLKDKEIFDCYSKAKKANDFTLDRLVQIPDSLPTIPILLGDLIGSRN